jgi:hypothetical protein
MVRTGKVGAETHAIKKAEEKYVVVHHQSVTFENTENVNDFFRVYRTLIRSN